MTGIFTIADYERASASEREACMKQIGVLGDLRKYLAFLNSSSGYRVRTTFTIGSSGEERSGSLHASRLAAKGTCPLMHYYDATALIQEEQHNRTNLQITFDIGTALHALFQTYLMDMYDPTAGSLQSFTPEVRLENKLLLLRSTTDGRMRRPTFRYMVELKTMKEGGDQGYAAVVRRPLTSHVRQLLTYMHMDDCPFGLLFYICKNNSELVEHRVAWDAEAWADIEAEALPIVEAVNAGAPPPPKLSSACRDCSYLHGCEPGKGHLKNAEDQKSKLRIATATARGRADARLRRPR